MMMIVIVMMIIVIIMMILALCFGGGGVGAHNGHSIYFFARSLPSIHTSNRLGWPKTGEESYKTTARVTWPSVSYLAASETCAAASRSSCRSLGWPKWHPPATCTLDTSATLLLGPAEGQSIGRRIGSEERKE